MSVMCATVLTTDPEVPGSIAGATRFSDVVGLEWGPFSLMKITEKLLGRNSSGSGLENRDHRPQGSAALTMQHPLPAKVGTNLNGRGGRLVGTVRLWVNSHEVHLFFICHHVCMIASMHLCRHMHVFIMMEITVYVHIILMYVTLTSKKQTNSTAFSPQANYTECAPLVGEI
jgi:hypothetical protein